MPPVIDSIEDIELHKTHSNNLQPETCDLCWMQVPFSKEELEVINSASYYACNDQIWCEEF